MFLTSEELQSLTHRVRPSAQLRALRAMGIEAKQRPDGTVAVRRADLLSVMGAPEQSEEIKAETSQRQTLAGWIDANVDHWRRDISAILQAKEEYELCKGPRDTGIYFLILDTKIQYVGIANIIYQRLLQHAHRNSERRYFTHYSWFGDIPDIWLPTVENYYIHHINPEWNNKILPPESEIIPYLDKSTCS